MSLRQLLLIIFNRSEFAGYNWLNIMVAPLFIAVVGYTSYLAYKASNGLVVVLVFALGFGAWLALTISLVDALSLYRLRSRITRHGERLLCHGFASYVPVSGIPVEGASLPEMNLFATDVVFGLTSAPTLCLSPTIVYTRQPLLELSQCRITPAGTHPVNIAAHRMKMIDLSISSGDHLLTLSVRATRQGADSVRTLLRLLADPVTQGETDRGKPAREKTEPARPTPQ